MASFAEVIMSSIDFADAIGVSTVISVILCSHCGQMQAFACRTGLWIGGNVCHTIKGLFTLDPVWMRIEFAFTRCALNANSIHIDRVHTAQSLKPNCCWHATPTAAQVTISALALSSQHSRCIETHTKVCTIICLTLSLVVDNVEREFRQTTWDHLVSGLFVDSI